MPVIASITVLYLLHLSPLRDPDPHAPSSSSSPSPPITHPYPLLKCIITSSMFAALAVFLTTSSEMMPSPGGKPYRMLEAMFSLKRLRNKEKFVPQVIGFDFR